MIAGDLDAEVGRGGVAGDPVGGCAAREAQIVLRRREGRVGGGREGDRGDENERFLQAIHADQARTGMVTRRLTSG